MLLSGVGKTDRVGLSLTGFFLVLSERERERKRETGAETHMNIISLSLSLSLSLSASVSHSLSLFIALDFPNQMTYISPIIETAKENNISLSAPIPTMKHAHFAHTSTCTHDDTEKIRALPSTPTCPNSPDPIRKSNSNRNRDRNRNRTANQTQLKGNCGNLGRQRGS